jgi:hypothetical protein
MERRADGRRWARSTGIELELREELQNKLAAAIINAELVMAMLEDGPARERVQAVLKAVWDASACADGREIFTGGC